MVTIILAALLAVFGIVAVLAYVAKTHNRIILGFQPKYALAATHPIASGTSLATARREGLLIREKWPKASLPADAVPAVTADNSQLVTSVNIPQGQLLVQTMLVTSTQQTGGLVVPTGMVAVTM